MSVKKSLNRNNFSTRLEVTFYFRNIYYYNFTQRYYITSIGKGPYYFLINVLTTIIFLLNTYKVHTGTDLVLFRSILLCRYSSTLRQIMHIIKKRIASH